MNINEFYKTYEEPEFIDERLENVVSSIVIARGKGFYEDMRKQLDELKNYFFKTLNDVVMTPELEASFPIWVFDNVEKVTDYNEYNTRLVHNRNLPRDIAYRILEIIFEY